MKENKKEKVSEIVYKYRLSRGSGKTPQPFRAFAADINKDMDESISFQALAYWENGKYIPQRSYAILALSLLDDWRGEFARDLLAALSDEPTEVNDN